MIPHALLLAAAVQPAEHPEPTFPLDDSILAERRFAADAQSLGQWTASAKGAHPDGGRAFRVHAWDGEHPRTVYDLRMPAPAEPVE